MDSIFEKFDREGRLLPPAGEVWFRDLPWCTHPQFEGVQLKCIVSGAQTDGAFSYHLVRIAPGCEIGRHVHASQLETHEVVAGEGQCKTPEGEQAYTPGVVAILPAKVPHAVSAGAEGLYLFAKFIPALS